MDESHLHATYMYGLQVTRFAAVSSEECRSS